MSERASIKLPRKPLPGPKVNIKRTYLDFANFCAATAVHTSSCEDWRLGTSVNLAAAAQPGEAAVDRPEWDIGHQGYRKPAPWHCEPVLTNWRLLR